ncbi:hypothetical protein [Stutzerimonas stutzeri]|uniref:hypothetical protein n=1 Tax=Stutzerimonas stutzeri TaxID=316 RepID=UPI001C2E5859|nr:hypothetical protein [Stutzerimonas stutzeri]
MNGDIGEVGRLSRDLNFVRFLLDRPEMPGHILAHITGKFGAPITAIHDEAPAVSRGARKMLQERAAAQ